MSASKAASLADASFAWDGTTSDLAQQYYHRYVAGDVMPQRTYATIPSTIQQRLTAAGTSMSQLPGLLQRALVWDSGYVENGQFDGTDGVPIELVAVKTLNGVPMAQIAIPYVDFREQTKCQAIQCNGQGYTWYQTNYCNGTRTVSAARCLVDSYESGPRAAPATWSIGGDKTTLPGMRLLRHDWIDYDKTTRFIVDAIHTAEAAVEPPFGRCVYNSDDLTKIGPGSLVIPCESQATATSERKSVMKQPKQGDLVTAWLQEFAQKTSAPTVSPILTSSSAPSPTSSSPTTGSSSPVTSPGEASLDGVSPAGVSPVAASPSEPSATTSTPTPVSNQQQNGTSSFVIIYPAVGVALLVLGLVLWWCCRRRARSSSKAKETPLPTDPYLQASPTPRQSYAVALGTLTKHDTVDSRTHTVTNSNGSHQSDPSRDENVEVASSTIVQRLRDDTQLAGKFIPYEQLELANQVSSGAHGEVWVGYQNGAIVAAKRLLRSKRNTQSDMDAFSQEIQLSARLHHPNIVRFIGVSWRNPEDLCMVLEFLPAGDLSKVLRESAGQLTWSDHKINMVRGMVSAVAYLHSQTPAIIHRDLKSKNVLLTNTLEPKLIDFGVSRRKMDITMTVGVGTPYWTAPEVLEGVRYTEKSDVYSLGVLLTEVDTCQMPFHDVSSDSGGIIHLKILHEVVFGELRPTVTDSCPEKIRNVVAKCLHKDPSQRPTAAELLWMLA